MAGKAEKVCEVMYKKWTYILVFTLVLQGTRVNAQTAQDSVKAVINQLFSAMRNSDSGTIYACFDDSAILQTIIRNREGKVAVRNEKVSGFAKSVGSLPKGAADERIAFEHILVDGPMAVAWTPYEFYYNGKYSHKGVNMFQLVNFNGQWKIHFLIDTRRKE
jgi:hypothetical protein